MPGRRLKAYDPKALLIVLPDILCNAVAKVMADKSMDPKAKKDKAIRVVVGNIDYAIACGFVWQALQGKDTHSANDIWRKVMSNPKVRKCVKQTGDDLGFDLVAAARKKLSQIQKVKLSST